MRGMILAAGRGERMGDLTKQTPKPLLQVGGQPLIEYAIRELKAADITDIVVNVSYLGQQIKDVLGNGNQYGVTLEYSDEPERLETGGGIVNALPLLGAEPFVVLSSDVICDFPLASLPKHLSSAAHLILVPNPVFHPNGDFGLRNGYLDFNAKPTYTFANIGVYSKAFFADAHPGSFPLNQLLFPAIDQQQITGEIHTGVWHNIGTAAQIDALNLAFA